MLRLTKKLVTGMSIKNKLSRALSDFLTLQQDAVLRSAPTTKQRKYKNIQITQDFKKIDKKRKKQRYENLKKREYLLQQKLKNQTKLLQSPQHSALKIQLTQIKQNIQQYNNQIAELNQIIDSTQAEYMVLQGTTKLVIINHIIYLQHLHKYNPGYTLHPQTIKAIQNIHYCVNHNLPVNRIQLYEIFPGFFVHQIGQLEQSVRRLIEQKNIFVEDQDSQSSVRFFYKTQIQKYKQKPTDASFIQKQIENTFDNLYDYCYDKIDKHHDLLQKVVVGKTPFRNIQHMNAVMLSDMPIKYLPQQQALRKDLLQVAQLQKQWINYKKIMQKQIQNFTFSYFPPPAYIKNHPVLNQRFEQVMKKITNPLPFDQSQFVKVGDQTQAKLFQKIQKQIRTIVTQKYDPMFIQAMNSDRSKIDKKKIQIQFYNFSTNIMQDMLALQGKINQQQQIFKKLPKQNSLLLSQRKNNLIPTQFLPRILYLNNKNKTKYNIQFFAEWLGIDQKQLQIYFKYVSYLRVPEQQPQKNIEHIKIQILKFQV